MIGHSVELDGTIPKANDGEGLIRQRGLGFYLNPSGVCIANHDLVRLRVEPEAALDPFTDI